VRSLLLSLVLVLGGVVGAESVPPPEPPKTCLIWGVFAYLGVEETTAQYQPLADYLNATLHTEKVELRVMPMEDLQAGINAQEFDLVTTNPNHYLVIRQSHPLTGVIASLVNRDIDGTPVPYLAGVILTTAGRDDINDLRDLRRRRIAVPSLAHMGGYQAQALELGQAGMPMPESAGALVITETHYAAITALLAGRADAAFVRSGIIERMVTAGRLDRDAIKIINERQHPRFAFIHSTAVYPEWPVFALPHADDGAVRRFAAALFALEPDHPAALAAGIHGYRAPADYLPVERMARHLRLPPYDQTPNFGVSDVWERWQVETVIAVLLAQLGVTWLVVVWQLRRRHAATREQLLTQAKLFEKLAARAPGMLFQYWLRPDGTSCFPMCTDGVRHLYETTPVEVIKDGAILFERLHPEDHPRVLETVRDSSVKGTPWQCQYRVILPSLGIRWLEGQALPEPHPKGGTLWHGYIGDITARKIIELEAESRRQELAEFFKVTPDLLCMVDAEGRFVRVNDAWSEKLGLSIANLTGARFMGFVHPDDVATTRAIFARLKEGERIIDFVNRYQAASGEYRHIEWRSTWVNGLSYAAARDITDRLRIAQHMAAQQRRDALGTLAGGVAHNLNNTLTPILITAELLEPGQPVRAQDIDLMKISVTRAADMVRQLLAYTRGGTGYKTTLEPAKLLTEIRHLTEQTFPKNITLDFAGAAGLPPVYGESVQVHQVLLNLCLNARDAMPEGGRLTLRLAQRHLAQAPEGAVPSGKSGHFITWSITDTGTGIDPTIIDRIFEPYFTTKDPDKGTGMGLASSLGIVSDLGGFMTVDSRMGQGTTFTLFLPVHDEPENRPPALPSSSTFGWSAPGPCILLVDDEESVLDSVAMTLRQMGCTVHTAPDAATALRFLAAPAPEVDLLLTDIQMPDMDGLALVRAVRQCHPHLPIITASGLYQKSTLPELTKLGVSHFLEKPFGLAELEAAIKAELASHRA
jgi:PAS domain S-box-containing protein